MSDKVCVICFREPPPYTKFKKYGSLYACESCVVSAVAFAHETACRFRGTVSRDKEQGR